MSGTQGQTRGSVRKSKICSLNEYYRRLKSNSLTAFVFYNLSISIFVSICLYLSLPLPLVYFSVLCVIFFVSASVTLFISVLYFYSFLEIWVYRCNFLRECLHPWKEKFYQNMCYKIWDLKFAFAFPLLHVFIACL